MPRIPNTSSVTFRGADAEGIVIGLDLERRGGVDRRRLLLGTRRAKPRPPGDGPDRRRSAQHDPLLAEPVYDDAEIEQTIALLRDIVPRCIRSHLRRLCEAAHRITLARTPFVCHSCGRSTMPKNHILEGDLSRIQLPDVLSFLSMIRGTGKLLLDQDRMERSIYWKDGEIVFASSNSPEHSLGMFLLRNGKITQQQYDESKRRVTADHAPRQAARADGRHLAEGSLVGREESGAGDHLLALQLERGELRFRRHRRRAGERAHRAVDQYVDVIMEGIRRLDETAMIREKITSLDMVFMKVPGAAADFGSLDMSEHEVALYNTLDGKRSIRALIGGSEMTEFEVTRILFQLLSARLIEVVADTRSFRPVFLDVEDSPELLKVISTYNDMFGRLYAALLNAVGEEPARDIVTTAMQNAESDELWSGVFFDQYGRFDENMLIANISELPFERRKAVLDEGLNTLLSVQLFEVSQHLDSAGKVDVFRFISDQKAGLDSILT